MGIGLVGAYGAAGLHDELLQELARRRYEQEYADKQRQQAELNRQAQERIDLERQQGEAERARWGAQDQATAQAHAVTAADQLSQRLSPLQSISPMAGGVLRAGNLGDLVKQNPPNEAAPFLGDSGQPDYNPGQQPGEVYTGTQPQVIAMQKEERAAQAPSKFEEWRQQYDYEAAHPKPTKEANPQPQIFYDDKGVPHAIQFVNGKATEIPMPPGMAGKAPPKGPDKLPQREDDTVVSIHQMMPIIDELLSSASGRITKKGGPSGMLGQVGQRIERGGQGLLYRAGIANPAADVDKRQQLASLLQILGTVPYLRGIRNMQFVQQIQQHLADPSATDESIVERLKTLKGILPGMEQAIYDVHNKGVIPHEHQPSAGVPQIGDIKTFPNGNKAKWDGKGWAQVP